MLPGQKCQEVVSTCPGPCTWRVRMPRFLRLGGWKYLYGEYKSAIDATSENQRPSHMLAKKGGGRGGAGWSPLLGRAAPGSHLSAQHPRLDTRLCSISNSPTVPPHLSPSSLKPSRKCPSFPRNLTFLAINFKITDKHTCSESNCTFLFNIDSFVSVQFFSWDLYLLIFARET